MGDHPRSRGVYSMIDLINDMPEGSSPLARGLHYHLMIRALLNRIIPARAGFTEAVRAKLAGWGDHPRSRGVYVLHARMGDHSLWIIPARAGFTP